MFRIKKIPNTFTILLLLICIFSILTFILPAGKYQRIENEQLGRDVPVPGSYQTVESTPQGFFETLMAPISGFYNPSSYEVAAVDVSLFVLMVGGFLAVVTKTGAIDTGIARVMIRLKGRELWMIPILMFLFCLGGTSYGMAEETLAFYGLLIPVFIAAGFDPLVAVGVIFIGSGVGTLGSTINPFGTVIASNAADVDFVEGIALRIAVLGIAFVAGCVYVMRYAQKIKNNPSLSLVYRDAESNKKHFLGKSANVQACATLTQSQKLVLILFAATFIIMVYGVSSLGWWMAEMSTLFIAMSIVCGIAGRLKEDELINSFISGAADLIGVALIIGVARGIVVVMEGGGITDTILNYCEELITGKSSIVFINTVYWIEMLLASIVSSTSGLAVMTMPILAPLSDFANTSRELVVSAYMFGIGTVLFVTPTYGVLMGALAIGRVPFGIWLRFIMPLVLFFIVLNTVMLSIGASM